MSRQLDYYYRHQKNILARLASKRKNSVKTSKNSVKTSKNSVKTVKTNVDSNQVNNKQIRIHALGIKHRHIKPLSLISIEQRLANAGIQYTYSRQKNTIFYFFKQEGLELRLTTQSLAGWAEERDVPQSPSALKEGRETSLKLLERALETAKRHLELNLEQQGEVIAEHIAFQHDEYAEDVIENKHKIELKDTEDQKARMLVDASKKDVQTGLKVPEIEFVHKKHAFDDSYKYAKHVEAIYQDRWNIDKQLEINEGLQTTMKLMVDGFSEIKEWQMNTTQDIKKIMNKLIEESK